MATAPNFYYNSPWIADAARSLATALAPPDRDKLFERQKAAWEFDYEKTKAQNEATDRAKDAESSGYLGELAQLYEHPVLGADGKPDLEATRAAAAGLIAKVVSTNPKYVSEAESVAGPLSAAFEAKTRFKADADAAAMERLRANQGFQAGENEKTRDFTTQRDEAEWERRLQYLYIQGQQHLDEINARNAKADSDGGGGNVMTLTPAIGKAIMSGIYQRIGSTGKKMDDAAIYRMFDEVADDTSRNTHNYATSLSRIWDTRFPGGVYQRKRGFFDFGGDDNYLTPDFNAPLPAFGSGSASQTTQPAADGARNMSDAIPGAGDPETDMENASRAAASAETDALPIPPPSPAARTPSRVPRGGAPTGKSASSPIPVKTPAEAAKLKKGTWIIDPMGRVGRSKGPGR